MQKLHGLCVLSEFVCRLGQMRKSLRVVRVQHAGGLHRALLRLAEVFESVRICSRAEEHFAVVEQHVPDQMLQKYREGRALSRTHLCLAAAAACIQARSLQYRQR